ncbi:hypothetical protein ACFSJU_09260 [Paradesertivirga mongoliensis]|uniref:Uncharacterized protein n=1 Tax=Paradesertivirga mongoliensis TaxID=2100740 RepID=A0ABW4ZM07_9SPHI|nr:hypothetical protein [Pedobacter mongoliensis]
MLDDNNKVQKIKMQANGILLSLMLLISSQSLCQTDLRGIWNGRITTDNHEAGADYMISIEEHKDGIVSGKALLYKPNLFAYAYGVQQFFGTIEKGTITINDIQIIDGRLPTSQYYLCFKLSKLQYKQSDGQESLSGNWTSETPNCLPGKISLTRLDEQNTAGVPEYVLKAIKRYGTEPGFRKTTLSKPLVVDVSNKILKLELKDYLKEDNDTVSIFFNRQPLFNKVNIKKKAHTFIILLNSDLAVNELIMYANNLGTIPPNTSNLVISDGRKTHNLLIESTLQKSVAIYLKYNPR